MKEESLSTVRERTNIDSIVLSGPCAVSSGVVVGEVGFEPTQPCGNGFTVRSF